MITIKSIELHCTAQARYYRKARKQNAKNIARQYRYVYLMTLMNDAAAGLDTYQRHCDLITDPKLEKMLQLLIIKQAQPQPHYTAWCPTESECGGY